VRLGANALVLGLGFAMKSWPGIVVGTLAVATGVFCEAVYAALAVRPVLRGPLREAPVLAVPLTVNVFLRFYAPLAVTPVLMFFAMPLASGAMGRMPLTIESLAVWPVLNGFVFTMRSTGFSISEVVISLLDRPGAGPMLRRFTIMLSVALTGLILAFAATPLGRLWFSNVAALPPALVVIATTGLWLAAPMAGLSTIQSWYQGVVVHSRRTRAITESMIAYLVAIAAVLGIGIRLLHGTGLYIAIASMTIGNVVQTLWLRRRALGTLRAL
jgi:hypothetical protein